MKKLTTVLAFLFLGFGIAQAEKVEDDRNRGYQSSFIFTEGGIEFAIFPDGQFDFNYLDNGPQLSGNVNFGNLNVSFNTGYDYDPYVQYDQYGAVIQIENTPLYYDSYGRIIQAGNININYRNGYVNNVGNLYVRYSRPGVIFGYSGYINAYNRTYVYRPWHSFYHIPVLNHVVLYTTPYRAYYNPIRFAYSYHRNYWNSPSYYNGCYVDNRAGRNFYHPYDNVDYNSYERGSRNSRGRAIANGRRTDNYRKEIASGRNSISRNDSYASNGRAVSNVRSSESRNYTNNNKRSESTSGRSTRNNNEDARSNRKDSRGSDSAITGRTEKREDSRSNDRASNSNQRSSNSNSSSGVQSQSRTNGSHDNARSSSGRSDTSQRAVTSRQKQSTSRESRSTPAPQRSTRAQSSSTPQRSSGRTASPQRSTRNASQKSAPSRSESNNSSSGRSSSRSNGRSSGRR
jgi:hypothetical protein